MIFTAFPVRFPPNSGSLCRGPAGYSSFSTPNYAIYSVIIAHFCRLSTKKESFSCFCPAKGILCRGKHGFAHWKRDVPSHRRGPHFSPAPAGGIPMPGTWGAFFSGKEPAPHPGRKALGRVETPQCFPVGVSKGGGAFPERHLPLVFRFPFQREFPRTESVRSSY